MNETGVVVMRLMDRIELRAVLLDDDYPVLDRFDQAVVASPVQGPADMLQSMEILMRRALEQKGGA